MSGAVSIPLAALALFYGGAATTYFWALSLAGMWAFTIGVIRRNHTLLKQLNRKADANFKIEGISCDMETLTTYICQFRVRNNNPDKTAENIRVELLEMKSSTERNKPYFEVKFPVMLMPEKEMGSIAINPGAEKNFTLFDARKIEEHSRPNINVPFTVLYYVMSEFKNSEVTAIDHKKFAFFEKNTDYSIKIRITARDFPPTEMNFNLNFVGEKSDCRFTLN